MAGELDPNRLRDVEIKRLVKVSKMAYRLALDSRLPMKMREEWHTRYTNAVLALNQLLKDAQARDYERRLRAIEEDDEEL